ncbi:MAG: cysteine desulfurase family protein, partial [Pseudomonas sp.]
RKKAHFVSCRTEHKSILGTLDALSSEGHATSYLPVDEEGLIDLDALSNAIRPETILVSIMAANGEIGVLQPMEEISALCKSRGIPLHTDAAQAFGKIDMTQIASCVDLISLSAHKIYGPKGVGALYINPMIRTQMRPIVTGAGQQQGLRAGTLPTPLIVGFGAAAELATAERVEEMARIGALRDLLLELLERDIGPVHVNGSRHMRLTGNLNLQIPGVDADSLLLMVPDLAISTGSACASGALGPSDVLLALGLSQEEASQSLRLGLGRMTTRLEVDAAVCQLCAGVRALRDS